MGCQQSAPSAGSPLFSSYNGERFVVSVEEAFAFPPWCFRDCQIDNYVQELVRSSWKQAMSGDCPPFKEAEERQGGLTPLVFFYNTFYDSFFSLAPDVKPLFKRGMAAQGRMLSHLINFVVNNIQKGEEFDVTLRYLAVVHNQRGVDVQHYSTMGLCLLFALRKVCGEEVFTSETRYAWTCVYSRIMQLFMPIVVAKTLHHDPVTLTKVHDYKTPAAKNDDFNYKQRVSRKNSERESMLSDASSERL